MELKRSAPADQHGATAAAFAFMAIFAASCSTQHVTTESSSAQIRHASARSLPPLDLAEKQARLSALLDRPEIENASFMVAQFERAQIAVEAGVRQHAHEAGFSAFDGVDEEKIGNIGAAAGDAGTVILAQNSMQTNNGGWREEEEAYRHEYSGMRCPKELDMILNGENGALETIETDLGQIKIYDTAGMDTSCDYGNTEASVYLSLYASNWPDVSLQDHFGASLKLIVDRFPLKSETQVLVAQAEKDESAPTTIEGDTLAAAFITEPMMDDKTFKTALWLNKTGAWHVKARATFPVTIVDGTPELSLVELVAATMHEVTLNDVDAHIRAAQTVSYRN